MSLWRGSETILRKRAAIGADNYVSECISLAIYQQIHLVTGKGGVGKSAVAAALALKKARQGQKTLLVELGSRSFFQDYFAIDQTVSNSPLSIANLFADQRGPSLSEAAQATEASRSSGTRAGLRLDLALWSGESCLHEYALHLLKLESLYRLFFDNPVTKTLIQVAPGLNEISIAGKITSHARQVGPRLDYDCLVIDAFATGHFLALVKAAHGMSQAVRFGPMGEQSRQIDQVLRDPAQTSYYVVSLPEEMPVHEALELSAQIQQHMGQEPIHILNRMLPEISSEDLSQALTQGPQLAAFGKYVHNKIELQQHLLAEIKMQNNPQVKKLPWVFTANGVQVVNNLCASL